MGINIGTMTKEDMREAIEEIAGAMTSEELSEVIVVWMRSDETLLDETMTSLEQQNLIEGGW